MHPYLKNNVVLVEGPKAFGVYDLNEGRFHRINKVAGSILEGLQGTKALNTYSDNEINFLLTAKEKKLIEFQDEERYREQTKLQDVTRSFRPIRFAWIEVTSMCNQKCLHCFLGNDLNRYTHQAKEKIFEHIDTLVEAGVSQIVISGGEPLLHPNIEEVLLYAARSPISVTLLTNGTSPKALSIATLLADLSINVKIPLLGWKESHDQMTALRGSFRKAIKTIHHYIRSGVAIELGTTVTSLNINDIAKIRKYANRVRLALEVSPIFATGCAKDNKEILLAHSQKTFTQVCREDKKKAVVNLREFPAPKRFIQPKQPTDYQSVDLRNFLTDCHECGQKITAITSSGEVTPCLLLRGPAFSMGNVNEHPLADLLTPKFPSRKEFDDKLKLSNVIDCDKCEARFVCKAGGCPATSQALKGTIHVKNPLYSKCFYLDEDKDLKQEKILEIVKG